MHMADALISPEVGGALWAVSGGLIAYCSKKVRTTLDDRKVPLMGVLGAFVFAAQMINFSIPGTGSSGHLGGGLLLAILLGPHAAFLTIASVLTVQALFFADGGLLALGCNMFNLGFFSCFFAYPLLYRKIAPGGSSNTRMAIGALVAAVAGLQLGAFSVVVETVFSRITSLPFGPFVLFMQPVHFAIGLVEGSATAGVLYVIVRARPDILAAADGRPVSLRAVAAGLGIAAVLLAGAVSWYASEKPDGLEWSIARVTGSDELPPKNTAAHTFLGRLQQKTALLPDYAFKKTEEAGQPSTAAAQAETSAAGIIGGMLTLVVALLAGMLARRWRGSRP